MTDTSKRLDKIRARLLNGNLEISGEVGHLNAILDLQRDAADWLGCLERALEVAETYIPGRDLKEALIEISKIMKEPAND
ncbi:hypothetical protein LCGC14_0355560 [marine sediment metagenome]|uniref:Uncharacterized protein n=1 Tax=marine sediment metagenome TaxID=412755 RepID=A0A0F9VX05_9ZZZZ